MPHGHAGDTCSLKFQMEQLLHVSVDLALEWIQGERGKRRNESTHSQVADGFLRYGCEHANPPFHSILASP